MAESPETVCLLDALPELAHELGPAEYARARSELEAPLVERGAGPWTTPIQAVFDPLAMGLFVMEGMLARHVRLADSTTTELVGRGDLLRPADYAGEGAPIPFGIEWSVLEPARLALLDRDVTAAVCRWQPVVTAIVAAAVQRSFSLAQLLAMSHLRRVDSRLLVLLWYLADRWGKVQTEGVVVPVSLTHEMLGRLVGAQRPSVTTALNQLEAAGRLSRRRNGGWVLHGTPPEDLQRTG
jgi:CRP/FNR family cyclic AMP-dependent transcriptional regulator